MLKRIVPCLLTMALGASSLFASSPESPTLQIDQPTGIPGSTLQPGTYTLRIVDHLTDRYVLRVEGPGAESRTSFLGIPNAKLKTESGKIAWGNGPNGETYLKGWNFAGSTGPIEFVYPKDDAVALAKANGTSVAAIDPASEGRVSANGLSKEDMQMVTLWLLTPTHVGPKDASGGIKAEKLQQVASLSSHKPPVATRLPRTGSYLPLVELLGALFVAAGFGLRLARFRASC